MISAVVRCALVLALLPSTATAESRPTYGGAAVGPLGSSVNTVDPLRAERAGELELVSLLFATPFALDGAGHPRPRLAVALENLDATHARLTIRPGLKFDDGQALTAVDVAASLGRAIKLPTVWALAPIRAARAVGDDVVEIELARPAPDLATLLCAAAASVTPRGRPPAQRVVGSGAFRFLRWDKTLIQLGANPLSADGRPFLDELSLRFFATRAEEAGSYEVGKLQVSLHGATAFDGGTPKHRTLLLDGPRTMTLALAFGRGFADPSGQRPPPGAQRGGLPDDPAFRRAIAGVIDRERLRRVTVREPSLPAVGLVPGQAPTVIPEGAPLPSRGAGAAPGAEARAEVARFVAGGRLRASLLLDASRFDDRDVADKLLADLSDVGIDLTVDAIDARSFGERIQLGTYDLALVEAGSPMGDGNPGFAALALLAAVDARRARALLEHAPVDVAAVERAVAERVALTPLFHRAVRVHHRADLGGLTIDGAGRVDYAAAHWVK